MLPTAERRVERSKYPATALQMQLSHCVNLFGVQAMTIADERGLLLASSDQTHLGEVLAAYAPLIYGKRDAIRSRVIESFRRSLPTNVSDRVSVQSIEVAGDRLFVCVLGERGVRKDLAVRRATKGTQRILMQAAA